MNKRKKGGENTMGSLDYSLVIMRGVISRTPNHYNTTKPHNYYERVKGERHKAVFDVLGSEF